MSAENTIREFNEKVEYVRSLIERMGYEGYVSAKLEYEIARAIARRLSALADYDLREIINEIYDSVDKSLSSDENLRIVESILNKYASNAYDSEYIESMYEAYQKWLESQTRELREGSEPREHYTEDWKSVLTASGGGRAKSEKSGAEKRAGRAEAKGVAELRELTARVSELASALSEVSAKLIEFSRSSAQLTELTIQLTELTKQLKEFRAGIEKISESNKEVRASHALLAGRLKELECTARRLEREVRKLRGGVGGAEPKRRRERVGIRVDNRVVGARTRRASARAQPRQRLPPGKARERVGETRVRLGGFEVAIDFRKAAKRILYL